jgi:UDP-GlcNAc:undecaprenyl-phosphate GlcNAc-1-phosphate transferase
MIIPVLFLSNAIGDMFRNVQTKVVTLLAAGAFMFVVGLVDDVRGLRARTKLLAQIAAAVAVCAFGIRIESVSFADGFTLDFGWLAWPITIFWIIGITNAVNLIDGLDGLSAGISAVTCSVIAVFAIYTGQPVMAILMLAMLGSLTGFLYFNFNPARIFMGDCGTMFLGFVLAASSVMCATKSATIVGLALPALALGVPIFDTLFSMLRRVLERRSIFAPDRSHIHHRLLGMGLTQRHVVLLMYAATLLAAGLGMFMMITRHAGTIVVFGCVVLLLMLMFWIVGAVRLRETITALQRNLAIARQAREHKREFEHAQLRIREAGSFDEWWQSVCAAAEQLGFVWLAMNLPSRNGSSETLVWRRSDYEPLRHKTITMTVPIPQRRSGPLLQLELAVQVNGSLESAGHRATLFTRLIEQHSLPDLPPRGGRRSAIRPSATLGKMQKAVGQ